MDFSSVTWSPVLPSSAVVSFVLQGAPELIFPTGRLVVTIAHSAMKAALAVELRSVWTDCLGNRQVTPLEVNQAGSGQAVCVAAGPVVGSAVEIAIIPTHRLPASVAVSGVIGFVGLVIPNVVRMLWGADHRFLLPASVLAGAAFVVLADTLARTVAAPTELPVGVVTAFVGVPFFVYLLRRRAA